MPRPRLNNLVVVSWEIAGLIMLIKWGWVWFAIWLGAVLISYALGGITLGIWDFYRYKKRNSK